MDRQCRPRAESGSCDPSERLRTALRVFQWLQSATVADRCAAIRARLGLSADDPSVHSIAGSPVVTLGIWIETDVARGEVAPDDDLAPRTLHLSDFVEAFGDRLIADGLATGTKAADLHDDFLHAFAGIPLRSYLSADAYAEVVRWARGRLHLV